MPKQALHSVMPTKQRGQHDPLIIEAPENESGEVRSRARVKWPTTIHRLHGRGKITEDQFLTARDLQNCHHVAVGSPQVISQYSDMVGHGSVQSAFARSEDAWSACVMAAAVCGEKHWRVVRDIVIADDPPITRHRLRWLKEGLDKLDKWGGLARGVSE
tara:strand:+ start:179 stop:655 length:477 start_codon:yes stop_codon:yes gene_type:complete